MVNRETWRTEVAAGIRHDVTATLDRLRSVADCEPLHPGTRAYLAEQIALWQGRLDTITDDTWWCTQVGDLAIAHPWRALDRLLHAGYARTEALEWLTHDGIDDPVEAALEWRGHTPDGYVEWRGVVTSRGDAERWLARGWSAVQVREVTDAVARRVAGSTGSRSGDWDAQDTEMGAWVESGIPAHRVVLYTRAGFTAAQAQPHETAAADAGDTASLDARLSALAALTRQP